MACLAAITGLLCQDQGMEWGCSTWGSSKTPCSWAKPGFGGHRAGFGVHDKQSKVVHRDRQGGRAPPRQDAGSQTLAPSPLPSAHYTCVCAPTRALMDELKMGNPSPRGARRPSRCRHIPGRQLAADPGSGKGMKNAFVCEGIGSWGDWQQDQAA